MCLAGKFAFVAFVVYAVAGRCRCSLAEARWSRKGKTSMQVSQPAALHATFYNTNR